MHGTKLGFEHGITQQVDDCQPLHSALNSVASMQKRPPPQLTAGFADLDTLSREIRDNTPQNLLIKLHSHSSNMDFVGLGMWYFPYMILARLFQ